MGLTKTKVFITIAVLIFIILGFKVLSSSSDTADQDNPDTNGTIVTTPEPTSDPSSFTPPPEPSPTPPSPDASSGPEQIDTTDAIETLSLEGEGFKAYESLPDKEIIAMGDTAAYGAQEYLNMGKGESTKDRIKRIEKYIHSKSNLIEDDIMTSGIIATSSATINTMELVGANEVSAIYILSIDVNLQLATDEAEVIPSITTTRSIYEVLVEKTDEGWKITDMREG